MTTMSGFNSLFGAALLAVACATEPPPRPVALDPANPAAAEGAAPTMTALAESPAPVPVAGPPPAGDEHQHHHGGDPSAPPVPEPPAAPAATEPQHGGSHEASPTPPDTKEEKPAPPKKRAPAKDKGAGKPATIYTCPMHPEVQSPKPGRCPKCGMKLVPQVDKPGAEKEHQH
jgi:heavy metal-binding protein